MQLRGRVVVLTLAVALAATAAGMALSGIRSAPAAAKTRCKPSWFVPSMNYRIEGSAVHVYVDWTYLARTGAGRCFINPNRPFNSVLYVIGRDGINLGEGNDGFTGDMFPGNSGGTVATIPVKKWCADQPVRVVANGASPYYATYGHRYHLTLTSIRIRC